MPARSGAKPSTEVLQQLPRPDGTTLHLSTSSAPIRTGAGIAGAVVVFTDVTERIRAEQALRNADQQKNEFLAVLSHELRNPLAPIRNGLHVLDRVAPDSDQAHRALAVIRRQVDQLVHLVDDLLDVTRITRNKFQLQRRRCDLNELVRRTVEDHATLFDKAGLHLELEPAPEPLIVNADWTRVAQVVGNLLHNAAKFTPPGGRTTVSVRSTPDHRAEIRVADTGVGLAPEMLGRVFEPFVQADATLARTQGGLGLGLALVKRLVELHDGEVRVSSDGIDEGATFVVRLPLDGVSEGGQTVDRGT